MRRSQADHLAQLQALLRIRLAWRIKNPLTIMRLMGHQEIKTTMIYIHHSQEMMKQELRKITW